MSEASAQSILPSKFSPAALALLKTSLATAMEAGKARPGTASASSQSGWVCFADTTPVTEDEKVFDIIDDIYLGSYFGAESEVVFSTLRFEGVINVSGGHGVVANCFDGRSFGGDSGDGVKGRTIEYFSHTMLDFAGAPLLPALEAAFPIMERWQAQKRRTLVHCSAGLSRSASIVVAWIMEKKGMSLAEAVALVGERRGRKLQINNGFWCQLAGEAVMISPEVTISPLTITLCVDFPKQHLRGSCGDGQMEHAPVTTFPLTLWKTLEPWACQRKRSLPCLPCATGQAGRRSPTPCSRRKG